MSQRRGQTSARKRHARAGRPSGQATLDGLGRNLVPGAPRLPHEVVARPRLTAALDAGVAECALTLVSAPPAAGKTVLLASWLAQQTGAVPVWVDTRLPDQAPIAARIIEAARDIVPEDALVRDLDTADVPRTPLVDRFLAAVEELPEPLVVVLDGLQMLRAEDLETLDHIFRIAPRSLRIVAASRFDPPLALHLLRVTDDLAEVRARDLAFTVEEAAELYRLMDIELSEDEVEAVVARTEGWAGGLALFGLSLRKPQTADRVVERFSLDERPATEYLAAEVLAAQPEELRDFLLRTSILETLDGELVDAVTRRSDGSRMLATLFHNNAFVERLDEDEHTYRYHTLFRDLLRVEAAAEIGADLPELHARAAGCLADRGRVVDAVRHAVDASRWHLVSGLVARHWDVIFAAGDVATARSFLEHVPRSHIAKSPALAAFASLLRFVSGDGRPADAFLQDAGKHAADAAESPSLWRYAEVLAARGRGDIATTERLAAEQAERATLEASDSTGEDRLRALGLSALGAAQVWQLAFDEAQLTLEEAVDLARAASVVPAQVEAFAYLGLLELVAGRLRRGSRMAQAALDLAELHGWGASHATTVARVVVASAEYQWGDLDAAAAALPRADAGARRTRDVLGQILAATTSAAIAASRGGDDADEALPHLRAARRRMPAAASGFLGGRAAALEARLLAATARLDEALEATAEGERDPFAAVATARVWLAQDEPERALAVLRDRDQSPPYVEIEALVTEAVALDSSSDRDGALAALAGALDLAEPEGIRRPFLDAGSALRRLLGEHLRRTNEHRWLATELGRLLDGVEGEAAAPAELLEPLSEREREVLRFLPTAMSNADIAAELFVSVNTVKTHVKSIYRKLNVTRRYDAVRRARQLRVL